MDVIETESGHEMLSNCDMMELISSRKKISKLNHSRSQTEIFLIKFKLELSSSDLSHNCGCSPIHDVVYRINFLVT